MADQRPQEANGASPQEEDVVAGLAQEDELGLFDFFDQFFGAPPTVDEIRKATKEELLDPNRFKCGCTILGHALKHSITLEALELWLDRAPEVISIQNKHGNMALSQVDSGTAMNQSVVIANRTPPSDLLLLDSCGDTPLHCMLQGRAPHQV